MEAYLAIGVAAVACLISYYLGHRKARAVFSVATINLIKGFLEIQQGYIPLLQYLKKGVYRLEYGLAQDDKKRDALLGICPHCMHNVSQGHTDECEISRPSRELHSLLVSSEMTTDYLIKSTIEILKEKGIEVKTEATEASE